VLTYLLPRLGPPLALWVALVGPGTGLVGRAPGPSSWAGGPGGTAAPQDSTRRATPPPAVPPRDAVQAAVEHWSAGRRELAIAALEAQLATDDDPQQRELLARWQLAVHRYSAALATLERPPALESGLRGEALYALTRYAEALEWLDPSRPQHVLLVIDALEATGRLDEARAALQQARELHPPETPELLGFEGRQRARDGDHRGAVQSFRAALAADPLDRRARFGLGRSLLACGEREEGLAELARHRELGPLIDGLDFARQSADLAPLHAPNLAAIGDAERALGLFERAAASYARAAELAQPDELAPIVLRHARLLEEDRSDAAGALGLLEQALARVADVRLAVRAGDVALRANRLAEACSYFERALRLRPGDKTIQARLEAAHVALEAAGG
jgi:tetratricopeptide (TPR) repeat protein